MKEKAQSGEIRLGGVVSALKLRNTKKGDRYANFNLEDKTGFIEVIDWPDTYKKSAELLGADDPIFVKGRLEVGEERMQVIANEVVLLAEAAKNQKNGHANGKSNGRTAKKSIFMSASLKFQPMSWFVCAIHCLTIRDRLPFICICSPPPTARPSSSSPNRYASPHRRS